MVQRILHQRYELQELIGGGGMADVYRARDKLLDRPVAVKILHDQFKSDSEFINKFHREAQAAARLSHANIVNIFDVGVEGNDHYIVMEYVPGSTLKDLIKQQGHLPVAQALRVAEDIARALAHAHANNLVHCDIKPHNILMMPDGSAKVADFGIARAVTESTMTYTGNIVGSVHYFSPEQAKGTMITPKSDVYALGVVLYEMLTGALPFTGETPVSIAVQHLQDAPRPVRELDPSLPPVVEAIVSRTMNKAPEARPSSAELVEELRQAEHMVSAGGAMTVPDPYATQVLPRVSQAEAERVQQEEEYEEGSEEEGSIFKSKKFIAGLVMVLMVGFFAGAFMSFGKFWSTAEVTVPDVKGKPMALARQILEDQKLRVNVAEVYDAAVPAGTVVSQTPEAGTKVKEERVVTINVSRGGEELEMPDLMGLDRSDAEIKLKKMGLKLGSVYEKFSDEEEGTVIGQEPRSGTKISKGQTVDITISKGKKVKKVTVPNVKGGTLSAAEGTLKGKGLSVHVEKQASSQAPGTVISQSPSADSEVEAGSTVTLVVAEEAAARKETSEDKGSDKKTSKSDSDTTAPSKQGETGKRQ
ncbi:Stk1 family PASTA domain-containing Ser/Thr kinase [Selenomonas sp. AB3002]|uniref:Stk1 family PASTA domain-containing Ser/Thr kinase n=1 Tax=Selenomonas sp. AB3002 TaxID=1392502 RepID=UPI000562A4A1